MFRRRTTETGHADRKNTACQGVHALTLRFTGDKDADELLRSTRSVSESSRRLRYDRNSRESDSAVPLTCKPTTLKNLIYEKLTWHLTGNCSDDAANAVLRSPRRASADMDGAGCTGTQ